MPTDPSPPVMPPNVDTSRPSAARVYDFLLGGHHNFDADREFARQLQQVVPDIGKYAQENRDFLRRAVVEAINFGYTQFLDIGSGIPTVGNVHQIADRERPERDTRVLYVDNDPVACTHTDLLLRTEDGDPRRHHSLRGDLLDTERLWEKIVADGLLNLDKPVVLLLVAVLHFVKDEQDPDAALSFLRDQLPDGSLLVLSSMTNDAPADEEEAQALRQIEALYERSSNPGQLRTVEEFRRFFGDWPLMKPFLVYAPAWRPSMGIQKPLFERPEQSRIIVGVAGKPGIGTTPRLRDLVRSR